MNHKIVLGVYDGLCLTFDTRREISLKYVAVFCFMFATCILNESACIHTMTNDIHLPENYIYLTLFLCHRHIQCSEVETGSDY